MKSIIIFYILCIILSFINNVFSSTNYKSRLYEILRKSRSQDYEQTQSKFQLVQQTSTTTTTPLVQELNANDDSMRSNIHVRDSWESDDDFYFQWAALNRRPMESLTGRKRSIEKGVTRPRSTRINTGIWRSGLVG